MEQFAEIISSPELWGAIVTIVVLLLRSFGKRELAETVDVIADRVVRFLDVTRNGRPGSALKSEATKRVKKALPTAAKFLGAGSVRDSIDEAVESAVSRLRSQKELIAGKPGASESN